MAKRKQVEQTKFARIYDYVQRRGYTAWEASVPEQARLLRRLDEQKRPYVPKGKLKTLSKSKG